MAGIISSKAFALIAGIMLAIIVLAESKCELLDHEPVSLPHVIQFSGGKMLFQASLAFVSNHGNTKKYVALRSPDQAKYSKKSKIEHVIELDSRYVYKYGDVDMY